MDKVENFHGCYLLCSSNPRYKGRTYVGYTVDPNRRINQHNKGLKAGGAWRTNNRGPWNMVLVVHGFPNEISALRFEWAWQHPAKSRRLRHLTKKQKKESSLQYCFRLLSEMLRIGPWNRLPLTIRMLDNSYNLEFKPDYQPPFHMAIVFDPVKSCKSTTSDDCKQPIISNCCLCHNLVTETNRVYCPICISPSHIICLAKHFLTASDGKLLPVHGCCPYCQRDLLWGDVIQYGLKYCKKSNESK